MTKVTKTDKDADTNSYKNTDTNTNTNADTSTGQLICAPPIHAEQPLLR